MLKTFSYLTAGVLVCIILTAGQCDKRTSIDFFREQNGKTSIAPGESVVLEWKVSNPSPPECFFNVDPEGPEEPVQTKVSCEGSNEQKPVKTTKFTLQARAIQEDFISKEIVVTVETGSSASVCVFDDTESKFDVCTFD